jgi:hypothetical protein
MSEPTAPNGKTFHDMASDIVSAKIRAIGAESRCRVYGEFLRELAAGHYEASPAIVERARMFLDFGERL